MTTTLALPEATPTEQDPDRLLHLYLSDPVKAGDKALCGHVKRDWSEARWEDKCVVCIAINETPKIDAERKRRGRWRFRGRNLR